ncbi:NAD(P)/FAD-dependent oxidoreductase [Chelativorans sp. J32]|uniref:NAD(P)/FAD-dependent oxidoreductase n=1 Tax=Chelativorans sp. J32 TaxID=935840 RepID=UPI0004AFB519|nr:FAD-dependent oxidoreductase [Chelativorans sp. J32]
MLQSVVIVGAGQAGAEAAMALRQFKFAGEIRLIGREASVPYERPPLSKGFLTGDVAAERLCFRTADAYARANIELILGREVRALDPAERRVLLDNGYAVTFDACILATGSAARRLDLPGAELANIFVLRTIEDAQQLRRGLVPGCRLAVIGGGYLGLEAAASARKLGASVTVIEALPSLLSRSASPLTADALCRLHRRSGIEILLGEAVKGFSGELSVESVMLASGRAVAADLVLVAAGGVAETALAQDAGIDCANGILTDSDGRTNIDGIYAVGDCANAAQYTGGPHRRLESVQCAVQQARRAAAAVLGLPRPAPKVPYFWSEQFGLKLQIAGLVEPGVSTRDEVVGDLDGDFAVYRFSEDVLLAVEAFNRPRDFIQAQQRIGMRDAALPAA